MILTCTTIALWAEIFIWFSCFIGTIVSCMVMTHAFNGEEAIRMGTSGFFEKYARVNALSTVLILLTVYTFSGAYV